MADDTKEPDEGDDPQKVVSYWLSQTQFAERKVKPFRARGKQIIRRYRNKRTLTTFGVPIANRRMNVLWSNVQTQLPVMYSQTPKANVSRRNKTKDPVGRQASIVLQNCLQNSLGMEDFDHILNQVTLDRLLPGVGLAMVEYKPQIEGDEIGWQAAETRYIHWEDWLTNVARTWQEVWWWGYVVYLTREEAYQVALRAGDQEFADDVRATITLDHVEDKEKRGEDSAAKATIYCIWDSRKKQVLHIATGYAKAPLAVMPPPVNFDHFFPIPRPLQSTTTTDTTVPVADFDQYCDQADEIDLLTQRIGGLTKALRLRGIYAASMESIKELIESNDNDLIPVENWMMVMESGGLDKAISWFPIRDIAFALQQAISAREVAIQIMYQVTGISDIMRAATDPGETATAQQLKAQFGGIRIRDSQREVQRMIRDLLRLKAEVIAEHFTLEVIQAMSGVKLLTQQQKQVIGQYMQLKQQYEQAKQQADQAGQPWPPPPQVLQVQPPTEQMMEAMKEPTWEEVMGLLRNEKLRGFVVDVETDSTIEPDQQAQQQAAVEFMGAVAQFIGGIGPMIAQFPPLGPLAADMLAWGTRQFKGADTIEGSIDEFTDQLKKLQDQPPPPNPEAIKAQGEQQKGQITMQVEQMKAQATQADTQQNAQIAQMKGQVEIEKAQLDIVQTQLEHEGTIREMNMDGALADRQHEHAMKEAKAKPKAASNA